MAADDDLRVTLRSTIHPNIKVLFNVSPVVSESQTVKYQPYPVSHLPGDIQSYGGTSSRTFTVSGKFISRSPEEASKSIRYVNILRSWTKPYFGNTKSGAEVFELIGEDVVRIGELFDDTASRLGAPPDVLYLSAYSDITRRGNLYKIPTVMTSLSFSFPNDVNYIPSVQGLPVPTIWSVEINLSETHSPNEYSSFDLAKYRAGVLENF